MEGRFDYVKYDETAVNAQAAAKDRMQAIESFIESLPKGRAQALALTKLEEVYMWIGKAIRDDQVARGGDAKDQPARGE